MEHASEASEGCVSTYSNFHANTVREYWKTLWDLECVHIMNNLNRLWNCFQNSFDLNGSTQKHCSYIYHIDNRGPRNFLYSPLTIALLQKMDGTGASIPHKPCQNISPVISVPACPQCLHTSNFLLAVYFCKSYMLSIVLDILHTRCTIESSSITTVEPISHLTFIMLSPSYFSHLIFHLHTLATCPVCWHLKQLSIGGMILYLVGKSSLRLN